MDIDPDLLNDNFSSTMGTETLLAHDMMMQITRLGCKRMSGK
jgi:hypothetical protein